MKERERKKFPLWFWWLTGGLGLSLVPAITVLVIQGCNNPQNVPRGFLVANPTISNCTDAQTQESLLLKQFVDTTKQNNCTQDSDCVAASTGAPCGCATIVNQTAAQGYALYLSSSQYASIQQQARSLGCGVCNGSCAIAGTPACVQLMCVSK